MNSSMAEGKRVTEAETRRAVAHFLTEHLQTYGHGQMGERNSARLTLVEKARKYGDGKRKSVEVFLTASRKEDGSVQIEVEKTVAIDRPKEIPPHDCMEEAVPVKTNGAIGHGWDCGVCGKFLQAG